MNLISYSSRLYSTPLYRVQGKTMVILAQEWHQLPDEESVLLSKILQSAQLSVSAVHLLSQRPHLDRWIETINPARILSFGPILDPSLPLFHVGEIKGIPLIQAKELSQYNADSKKALWMALRGMYGLK